MKSNNNMLFIAQLIVRKCKEITATARSVLKAFTHFVLTSNVFCYCEANRADSLVTGQRV